VAANQIHLVRHGEVFNPDRVLYGRIPGYGLSERGHDMAKLAADDLVARQRKVARLIASPLQRAQESAAPIATALGHHVETEERIIEPTNHFEGNRMRGENSALKDPSNWPFLLNPFRPSWGEAYRSIADRMLEAMTEAVLDVSSGDVVMVSHQLPIWMVHRAVAHKPFIHDPRHRRCALSSITSFELVDADHPELGFREVGYANPARVLNENALDVGAV
jgi:broad specificity phosphatase PhoE